jgi:histidinol-phosphate aminotransferase
MSIVMIARPEIRELVPYSSARMEASGGSVHLNANESPWPPLAGAGLNRYPDPQPSVLLDTLAQLYDVAPANVLVGRGSDEAIDLLVRAFCRAGKDSVLVCPPTFGMYAVCARVQNAGVIEVPLTQTFEIDEERLLAAATPDCKIIFLCSPNNPTGGVTNIETVARIANALSNRALVVVDEAYIEFCDGESAATLLSRYPNVAVLRTLSKAFALAGNRIGTVLAHPDVIALLRRIQAPYPLPTPCVDIALSALSAGARVRTTDFVALLRRERERIAPLLGTLPHVLAVYASSANFLCVRFTDGAAMYRYLLSEGIVVRNVGAYPNLENCLRISIGTPDENARLLRALDDCELAA